MTQVKVVRLDGTQADRPVRGMPDECPVCHCAVLPVRQYQLGIERPDTKQHRMDLPLVCPRQECRALFIATYHVTHGGAYEFVGCVSPSPKQTRFDPLLLQLSPRFADVYNQAEAAEAYGLTEVAGMAYRKALEVLVKDFAIKEHSDQTGEIKKKLLMSCIKAYMPEDIQSAAELATWLGNDETHYERRWEGMDVRNLKELLQIVVERVQGILRLEHYRSVMKPSG